LSFTDEENENDKYSLKSYQSEEEKENENISR